MMGVTDRLHDRLPKVADIDEMPSATPSSNGGRYLIRR